jgi:hypothetical protein
MGRPCGRRVGVAKVEKNNLGNLMVRSAFSLYLNRIQNGLVAEITAEDFLTANMGMCLSQSGLMTHDPK